MDVFLILQDLCDSAARGLGGTHYWNFSIDFYTEFESKICSEELQKNNSYISGKTTQAICPCWGYG